MVIILFSRGMRLRLFPGFLIGMSAERKEKPHQVMAQSLWPSTSRWVLISCESSNFLVKLLLLAQCLAVLKDSFRQKTGCMRRNSISQFIVDGISTCPHTLLLREKCSTLVHSTLNKRMRGGVQCFFRCTRYRSVQTVRALMLTNSIPACIRQSYNMDCTHTLSINLMMMMKSAAQRLWK